MNICGDNRFEIIRKAKEALIESTNISEDPDEMKVLNRFLFRCWQMGWLDKYDVPDTNVGEWIPCSERLPDNADNYLCTMQVASEAIGKIIIVGHFNGKSKTWTDDSKHKKTIAWMPLPEPYKEDK